MVLIVGLGNPGKEFEKTRHNIGFRVIDKFAKENDFPEFKFSKKFNAEISKKDGVTLAKPQTFMNASGQSVKKIIQNTKYKIQNTIVVHDDLDIPLGEFKVSKGRGSAGHKGVESIIKELGTKDFVRLRIGISKKPVLEIFTKDEEKILEGVIEGAVSVDFCG